MRDLLRRAWLWFFGPSYYVVKMRHSGPVVYVPGMGWEWTAMSRCHQFGACPHTGVFTDYESAYSYWVSRVHEDKQPGFEFTIHRLHYDNVKHRALVLDFYKDNPEVQKPWA